MYFTRDEILKIISLGANVTRQVLNDPIKNEGVDALKERLIAIINIHLSPETTLTREEMDGENAIDKSKNNGDSFWEY